MSLNIFFIMHDYIYIYKFPMLFKKWAHNKIYTYMFPMLFKKRVHNKYE